MIIIKRHQHENINMIITRRHQHNNINMIITKRHQHNHINMIITRRHQDNYIDMNLTKLKINGPEWAWREYDKGNLKYPKVTQDERDRCKKEGNVLSEGRGRKLTESETRSTKRKVRSV